LEPHRLLRDGHAVGDAAEISEPVGQVLTRRGKFARRSDRAVLDEIPAQGHRTFGGGRGFLEPTESNPLCPPG
jgi:hypothetical protein